MDGHWTMGTANWATVTGVTPDFTFSASPAFDHSCGMVCWGAPGSFPSDPSTWGAGTPNNYVDCVAYGNYTGTRQTGDIGASLLTAGDGMTMSLQRMSDTSNDATDFAFATRTPTSNGVCATTTTTSSTTTTTVPDNTGFVPP